MVVTKESDEESKRALNFEISYRTENNTSFSIGSDIFQNPKANDMVEIRKGGTDLPKSMDKVLTKADETVNVNELYTTPEFEGGQDARSVLEYSMSDSKMRTERLFRKELMPDRRWKRQTKNF